MPPTLPLVLLLRAAIPLAVAGAPAPTAEAVAAMDGGGPGARLEQLIAARGLAPDALAALAPERPEVVWQLLDPRSRGALEYVLAMPPAEIRRVRDGQTVVRSAGDWTEGEARWLQELCDTLGLPYRRVDTVSVRTRDGKLLRLELLAGRKSGGADLAFPADWARADAVAAVEAWLGHPLSAGKRPTVAHPSFEDADALGISWQYGGPADVRVVRDTARAAEGASSVRLEAASPPKGGAVLSQRLGVRAGDAVRVLVRAAPDGVSGGPAGAELVFLDATGQPLPAPDPAWVDPSQGGWQPLALAGTVPADAAEAWLLLGLWGKGAVNFDDVRLAVGGEEPAAVSSWARYTHGRIVVRADPTRVPDASAAAARIEQALVAGATRLGVPASGTYTVFLLAAPADRAGADDPGRGACWQTADTAFTAACPLRIAVQRAWGAPGNRFFADGLTRALSGSGTDLHAAARPHLADLPPIGALAERYDASPAQRAAGASFAAWLLDGQGNAAVKAAWTARELDGYGVAGMDLAALDRAWRAEVAR